ncbi:MAG: 4Fe-4S binding protein [Candidatus Lokiarchaeota archaeon]|nr:4Fe-4S binding protein [Candidatus Lokiarchaeota archaeon]
MNNEKFFPISINPNLCIRCLKCMYSCHPKAVFFRNSMRYVDYDKCKGCLKCVEVCEHGAIEVISIKEGRLKGFLIDSKKCNLCKICLNNGFCSKNLFELQKNEKGKESIKFQEENFSECSKCLECFKNCPNKAIIPEIN